jgi:hypothetical protein
MLIKQKILFTKEECELIINLSKINNQNWKSKDRKYDSHTIEHMVETDWLFKKLKIFFETETNIDVLKIKKQIHFHKFENGDWFSRHNDIRDGRLYAIGVLLNNTFEGGDFKLYNSEEQTLNKVIGNAYIFDVRIDHEITPILNGERYSLLWFLQKDHINFKTDKSLI